jgi:hypothetical protein
MIHGASTAIRRVQRGSMPFGSEPLARTVPDAK